MARYTEVPASARGTQLHGGKPFHIRLDQHGQIMIVPGPDTRDWSKIDQGALDYSNIARLEHGVDGFTGHDSPRIQAACHLCQAGDPTDDLITRQTKALIAAKQAGRQLADGQTPDDLPQRPVTDVVGEVPTVLDPTTAKEISLRQQEVRLAEAEAALLRREKALLTPKTEADPDRIDALEMALDASQAIERAQFDAQVAALDGAPADYTADLMGTDPHTGQQVKISKNPGADRDAPHGRKADGTPRRMSGVRKP